MTRMTVCFVCSPVVAKTNTLGERAFTGRNTARTYLVFSAGAGADLKVESSMSVQCSASAAAAAGQPTRTANCAVLTLATQCGTAWLISKRTTLERGNLPVTVHFT